MTPRAAWLCVAAAILTATVDAQQTRISVGVADTSAGTAVDHPVPSFCTLTIPEVILDLDTVDGIDIGYQHSPGYREARGLLDIRRADVRSGHDVNVFRLSGALNVGSGSGGGGGQLYLNPAVTNITVGTLRLGGPANESPAFGNMIDLGTNAHLRTLTVNSTLDFNRGRFRYYDASGSCFTGLPNHLSFEMGTADRRAGMLSVATGGHNSGIRDRTVHTFGIGIGTFSAYLGGLQVAAGSVNGHQRWGALDLRGATLQACNIEGPVKIGGPSGHGKAWFPRGRVACTNLQVGGGRPGLISGTGRLSLSNTEFIVSGDVVVGNPYDTTGERGVVETTIDGVSAGLDIGGSLTVTNDARLSLDFRGPQTEFSNGDGYWGLRIAGDRSAVLAALHDSHKLAWTTNGLSEAERSRFGVHYWSGGDYTYIGVQPPYAALIMVY